MRFSKLPGEKINKIGNVVNKEEPTISIITPFYNGGKTLMETANTIFSQTYPYFEWIIIDDGSKDQESLKKLTELEKMDPRVRVLHKENGGPSQARDYGIARANKSTKYIYFLDCDDLIENNMLETLYWTLETHPAGSLAYPSMINFGAYEYYWEPYLTIEEELVNNLMCISTMIKKDDLLEVGCFEIKEKAMHEDWNLWLKLLAKGKIPIRTNAPLFWYRTSETGELSRANSNRKKAMSLIKKTAATVKQEVEVIQFPRRSYEVTTENTLDTMTLPVYEDNKTVLFLLDNATLNKDNIRILELIKKLNKHSYKSIVITTEPFYNNLRQEIKDNCSEFYDLTNFLDTKDYLLFINYLISSRKVKDIVISNSSYGYSLLPELKNKNKNIHITELLFTETNTYSTELATIIDNTLTFNNKLYKELKTSKNISLVDVTTKKEKINISDTNKIKEKLNIPVDKKIISYIDEFDNVPKVNFFINIAEKITKENSNVLFIMNGNGLSLKKAKKHIHAKNLMDKVLIFKEDELDEVTASEISDLVIDCSIKENSSIASYLALITGTPIVAPNYNNQVSIITNKNGKLISVSKNKSSSITRYYDKFVEAITDILKNIDSYKKASETIKEQFTAESEATLEEFITILSNKTTKKNEISCSSVITKSYLKDLNPTFNQQYLDYYSNELNIIPREGLDLSKTTQLKRKFRTFSLKYRIENEMHYVLGTLAELAKICQAFLKMLKSLGIFTLKLIPSLLCIIKIICRFIRILLSKVKQFLLRIIKH